MGIMEKKMEATTVYWGYIKRGATNLPKRPLFIPTNALQGFCETRNGMDANGSLNIMLPCHPG